jgi:pimeloyl-ACP methyl ester carboxylesterase
MAFFQLPVLPEALLRRRLADVLVRAGQSAAAAQRDAAGMRGPGALTAGLNWYRALPLTDPRGAGAPVTVPTLYIWSDGDVALGRAGADRCADHVTGPYRFHLLPGVSHWIPDEAPAELAAALRPHLARFPR